MNAAVRSAKPRLQIRNSDEEQSRASGQRICRAARTWQNEGMNSHQTRRDFLKLAIGSAAASALTADSESTSANAEQAATIPSMIIDTHTHFYDPTRSQGVPWPPKNDKLLYRTVLPKDYQALRKPQPVNGTVVVEASAWLEDNQWILDLAANDPFIVGFVGHLEAGTNEFRNQVKRFAANRLFRGIRMGAGRIRQGLDQAAFIDDLRFLAASDLSLDVLGGPDLLPDVPRLAKQIPDLRIIIDHVANVKIDGRAPDGTWRDGIQGAAQHKSVFCKVSGLVEGTGKTDGKAPSDVEFYRPTLDVVWGAFGADRVIYGSNWPVSERFAPCAVVQQVVTDYFSGKGDDAVEKYFWKNALAVYKWVMR